MNLTAFPRILDSGKYISSRFTSSCAEGNSHISSRNAANRICQGTASYALSKWKSAFILISTVIFFSFVSIRVHLRVTSYVAPAIDSWVGLRANWLRAVE